MRRTVAVDVRISDRRRSVLQERARRRRRRLGTLAVVVGLLAGAVLVARSPLLAVADVRVAGVSGEREEQVRDAAGVRPGDNLLHADLAEIAGRVEALPWVADAQARRVPPSAVAVDVTPREPIAVVHAGDAAWLLDADGIVTAGGRREGLPVITAPEANLPPVGGEAEDEAVRSALAVHAALPDRLRDAVDRYDAAHGVPALRLRVQRPERDPVWVRFGAAEEIDAKAQAIALLLAETQRYEDGTGAQDREADAGEAGHPLAIEELDVRAPHNPVLVPETGS